MWLTSESLYPGTGTYIKYALDNAGRLSLGKGHGRRRTRLKSHQARKQQLTAQLFGGYLVSQFKKAQAQTEEGKEISPLDEKTMAKAYKACLSYLTKPMSLK